MATTFLKSLHINKGKSIAKTLFERTEYVKNPQKTDEGRLVTSYHCNAAIVDEEFLMSKKEYEYITGRNQGKSNVLAYHIRQAFKPGEVSAEEANEIGRQLALSFTKGNHAFIVCTHIDKHHTHNHIIFNSTTLDCEHKFRDFKRSAKTVRHISDLLCAEHGLSIIQETQKSKGRNYGKWLGDEKPMPHTEILKKKIDEILPNCNTWDEFLAKLRAEEYEINTTRKYATAKFRDWKQPIRFDTLKGDYTEVAIRERIAGTRIATPRVRAFEVSKTSDTPSLLIDIQTKIREGKGAGYEQWSHIFNIRQMAKTLTFLQENKIDNYNDLCVKADSASVEYRQKHDRIKVIDNRLKEISELQKYIGQYSKTKDVYAKYKASGWDRNYYDICSADIILHRAAKKYFDSLGLKKMPSINSLKQEYATIAAEKKQLYSGLHELKDNSRALQIAKDNAAKILNINPNLQSHDDAQRTQSHAR